MAVDDPDDLYGLPLEDFVPERDALSKRLRADGKRQEASDVKDLRKPSVAAWAVNQAVRTQPGAARELWDAGDALIGAQEALLGRRGDAGQLRAAVQRERAALDTLVQAARGLLTGRGRDLGDATIERVHETLHAAAIDPQVREQVAPGRVTREMAHAGIGGIEAAPGSAAPEAPAGAQARRPGGGEAPAGAPGEAVAQAPGAGPARGRGRGGAAADAAGRMAAGEGPEDAAANAPPADTAAALRKEAAVARRQEVEAARRDAAARAAVARELARRRAAAEKELREAMRAVEKAEQAVERSAERLRDAQVAAGEAQADLDVARERRREAAAALIRAEEAQAAGEG